MRSPILDVQPDLPESKRTRKQVPRTASDDDDADPRLTVPQEQPPERIAVAVLERALDDHKRVTLEVEGPSIVVLKRGHERLREAVRIGAAGGA